MTLPELRIPPKRQPGLAKLQALSAEVASSLLAAIQKGVHQVRSEHAAAADLPEIAGLTHADTEEILGTLLSLYRVRANAEVTNEQFIEDVCDFMLSQERGEQRLPQTAKGEFSDRLRKFLSIDDLTRAAKAIVLRYEHEHPICRVRILTDARPLFAEDPNKLPEAAVIFHLLKIAYHDPDDIRETFFALDETDLEQFKNAIVRAESKAETLRKFLESAGVKVISPE